MKILNFKPLKLIFIFNIFILTTFLSIAFGNEKLENDFKKTISQINNLNNKIAINSAELDLINKQILIFKAKKKVDFDWMDEIKLNLLLKKSYSISLEIDNIKNEKNILDFVKNDIANKLIDFYEKRIIDIVNKAPENAVSNEIETLYLKKEKLISSIIGMEKNSGIKYTNVDKTNFINEKDLFVKLGLLQDLLAEIKVQSGILSSKIIFFNKEIDFSEKLIYHFNFSKKNTDFKDLVLNKVRLMKAQKRNFSEILGRYNDEYSSLSNDEKKLNEIVLK